MGTILVRLLLWIGISLLLPGLSRSTPLSPVGFVEHSPAVECLDAERSNAIAGELRVRGTLSASPRSADAAMFPLYDWPLERGLRDGYILVNYVDDDPTAAIHDYEGFPHSYNGHNGTDITLYNFRLMDRGQRFHVVDPSKPIDNLVDAPDPLPAMMRLGRATPNPSTNFSTIQYTLSRRGSANLGVFDVAGRRLRTLVDGDEDPGVGPRTVTWDGRDESGRSVGAGIYFFRLDAEGRSLQSKVALLH